MPMMGLGRTVQDRLEGHHELSLVVTMDTQSWIARNHARHRTPRGDSGGKGGPNDENDESDAGVRGWYCRLAMLVATCKS